MANSSSERWDESRFRSELTSFCFGTLDVADREAVERHLFACDECWTEFQRLDAAVRTLRFDHSFRPVLPIKGVVSLMGLSGRLGRPFAGHRAFALVGSALFALLFALPVLVELAYEFDRFRSLAVTLFVPVWVWMCGATALGFALDVRAVRLSGPSVLPAIRAHALATIVLCAVVLPLLPGEPTVEATFETYPVHLGYLKSVFYAWVVGPLFLVLPYHFVVVAQRELAAGRHSQLLALLSGEPSAVAPRGTPYPRVWFLGLCLGGIVVLNYFGVNYLFGNLTPSPHRTLFMSLVLLRVATWVALAAGAVWWYSACLDELKREALALRAVGAGTNGGGAETVT
jgi:hypothetical protein